jgi:L-idonate 5-dehydrogenase
VTASTDPVSACVVHAAGDLRVDRVPAPAPATGQIAVDIAFGGICGSDLHYYHRGAVGDFRLREPLVLGHEVVGHVAGTGPGVTAPAAGTPVAIHPATPCGDCTECRTGHRNVCARSRYLGSAAHTPHVQGGFAGRIVVPLDQVRVLPAGLDLRRAVLAEPLAVALHAVARAGDVRGRRVLVTGAGPIGCLVVAALRAAGAAEVVAVDLVDEALAIARAVGATGSVRADNLVAADPAALAAVAGIDVAVEASGSPAGLRTCLERTRRAGTVVLLGLLPPGESPFLGNIAVTRELTLVGAFRFDTEFDEALRLLAEGLPVDQILTHTLAVADAQEAFALASDRTRASKVILDLR